MVRRRNLYRDFYDVKYNEFGYDRIRIRIHMTDILYTSGNVSMSSSEASVALRCPGPKTAVEEKLQVPIYNPLTHGIFYLRQWKGSGGCSLTS